MLLRLRMQRVQLLPNDRQASKFIKIKSYTMSKFHFKLTLLALICVLSLGRIFATPAVATDQQTYDVSGFIASVLDDEGTARRDQICRIESGGDYPIYESHTSDVDPDTNEHTGGTVTCKSK